MYLRNVDTCMEEFKNVFMKSCKLPKSLYGNNFNYSILFALKSQSTRNNSGQLVTTILYQHLTTNFFKWLTSMKLNEIPINCYLNKTILTKSHRLCLGTKRTPN